MFSVFSSQELAQLFVVNNIHRSFDPENPYVWEQAGTWKQQQQLFIWHKHIPESYIYIYLLLKNNYWYGAWLDSFAGLQGAGLDNWPLMMCDLW